MHITTMFLVCAICSPFLNYLCTKFALDLLNELPGDEALRSATSMRAFYKKFYIVMTIIVAILGISTESIFTTVFMVLTTVSIYITVDPMMDRLTAQLRLY